MQMYVTCFFILYNIVGNEETIHTLEMIAKIFETQIIKFI